MGDEAEARFHTKAVHSVSINGQDITEFVSDIRPRFCPPDDDEYMTIQAVELVGREIVREDGAAATARFDDGFVVVEYPEPFHRTLIRAEVWVRIRRAVPRA